MIKSSIKKPSVFFSFRKANSQQFEQQKLQQYVKASSPQYKNKNTYQTENQNHQLNNNNNGQSNKSIQNYLIDVFRMTLGRQVNSNGQEIPLNYGQNKNKCNKPNFSPTKTNKSNDQVLSTTSRIRKFSRLPMNINFASQSNKIQQGEFIIEDSKLKIGALSISIKNITKAKILPLYKIQQKTSQRAIKLQITENDTKSILYISANAGYNQGTLPQQFQFYSDILLAKLQAMGITQKNSKWKKLSHILSEINLNSYIFGTIYKKSQMRSKWNQRYVVVREEGIYSYYSPNDKNYTFFIPSNSIKYIWTRFQFIHQFLIVKIKHGVIQTQFGIPITQFNFQGCNNWLYQFYRIINRNL